MFSRHFLRHWFGGLTAAAAVIVGSGAANAAIVERVVAVVGERPILLSELRNRARPHLFRIAQQTQNPTQQAAAESEMFRELLTRMIDERLEEQAGDKAHITVTPDEVDNGIRTIASQNKLDPKQLVTEAKKQGLTEQDYRDEVRRQVLEGKLIQLRVRSRVRVTEQDAKAAYNKYAADAQKQHPVDLRILVLQIPAGASQQTAEARAALGEEISRKGKAGEDFCKLVLDYSDDPRTKATCGSSGPVPLAMLLPELQASATTLKPGETSAPILFRDPQGQQAVLVTQLSSQPFVIPPYEQVAQQMLEQAYVESTERQRKLWLQELRHGVYVDVRL